MKTAIIDTVPKDARNQGSINLGYEIVANAMNADRYMWHEKVPGDYDQIAFNVFYPTHMLNVVPFLTRNGIEPARRKRRGPRIIAGGPGIGANGILSEIVDEAFLGELDRSGNESSITSDPFIKGKNAVIELTRGCRHRCKFCEYAATVKPYREKSLDLVIAQLEYLRFERGIKTVNLLSANLAGYRRIGELVPECLNRGVRILNTDSCLTDLPRLYPFMRSLPRYVKLGVESFDEDTRRRVGKPFSDQILLRTVETLLEHASLIHFYLIFGLPGDRYSRWMEWLETLAEIRDKHTGSRRDLFGDHHRVHFKNVRFEFSITNFEPCQGTAFENEPRVNFDEKREFLAEWGRELMKHRFFVGQTFDYRNAGGRIGRKEPSYELLMALKTSGPEITDELINCYPHGISRTISDKEALRFLSWQRENGANALIA